jgi:REP element-mobilizing transposase RayT
MRADVARLRNFALCPVLRRAFVHGCRKDAFRICQFSIQGNHIHLICEAKDATSLAAGVQAWAVRVARGLNRTLGRAGRVFDDRYHCEVIKSPRQTRAALCYVMQNARRHGASIDPRWNGVDPFSSAWWFDGWRDDGWRRGLRPPDERTVAPAGSWLLRVGWRRHGLLALDEVPAARRRAEARQAHPPRLAH